MGVRCSCTCLFAKYVRTSNNFVYYKNYVGNNIFKKKKRIKGTVFVKVYFKCDWVSEHTFEVVELFVSIIF